MFKNCDIECEYKYLILIKLILIIFFTLLSIVSFFKTLT